MKRECGCRHYGRYVDDAYVVFSGKRHLRELVVKMACFLERELGLKLQPHKTVIKDVVYGIEFLGAYVKPYRNYVRNGTKRRIMKMLRVLTGEDDARHLSCALNSYLGILSHYASFKLRQRLIASEPSFLGHGVFSPDLSRFILKKLL